MSQFPSRIQILPEHLIDQIKAGEVIERPGSLIKEILENAVDANATKIELTLKNNGLDLISLKDNGHGMSFHDLPMAFCRHATSKLSRFEDLYRLNTFGFRGEALASIASIAKVHCITQLSSEQKASEFKIDGGETTFHDTRMTSSTGNGTELVIQDLFYNTPVRLKFIQSQQSEKQYIKKIIYAFILSHPEIEFQLKIDDSEKELYGKNTDFATRLSAVIPKATGQTLRSQRFYENIEVEVYLVSGALKAPVKCQYIYINDRYVLDKQLSRVASNALTATFGQDDFHYLIFFSLPPDAIDVNVHPNKTLIKFLETSKLLSLLTSTIKEMAPRISSPSGTTASFSAYPGAIRPSTPDLVQGRQDYSMEGIFSPHQIQSSGEISPGKNEILIWLDRHLVIRCTHGWTAFLSSRLLEFYCRDKLAKTSQSIPLLVSEPFSARDVSPDRITYLQQGGVEIENLGKETLVLRSIPEWMIGFPLKEVITLLLQEKKFDDLVIHPADWSKSTWNQMASNFSLDYLNQHKIAVSLDSLLKEKLI